MPKHQVPSQFSRIADQVIEEVDEQVTVQSVRGPENRPTAMSIFAQHDEKPVRSAPIDVVASHHNDPFIFPHAQSVTNPDASPFVFPNNAIFSTSAPAGEAGHLTTPTINIDNTDESDVGSHKDEREKSEPLLPLSMENFVFNFPLFLFADDEDVDCTTPNTYKPDDDFEQLRLAREKERAQRHKQKFAHSVSQQTGGSVPFDTDLLLEQLANSRGEGLNRNSYIDPNT